MDHSDPSTNPSTPPLAIAVIETDTFCERCGFNLHTQRVWRDGRLGILVTRCPECGAHQAAGKSTSTSSAWLKRLALLGLLAWIGLATVFVIAVFISQAGMIGSSQEELVVAQVETIDGRPVDVRYNGTASGRGYQFYLTNDPGGATLPSDAVVQRWGINKAVTHPGDPDRRGVLIGMSVIGLIYVVITWVSGVLLGACCWFWRHGWRWAWLALPALAGGVVLAIVYNDVSRGTYRYYYGLTSPTVRGVELRYATVLVLTAISMLTLGAGLLVSRPLARLIVSVLVPPKSRQLFAFLWHVDGKTMSGRPVEANEG